MKISKKALDLISRNSDIRARLMLVEHKPKENGAQGVSEFTINKWIKEGDDTLTQPKYTSIISQYTGLTLSEIITQ